MKNICCVTLFLCLTVMAEPSALCNRNELSFPLSSERRVVAHYMSNMLYYDGGRSVPTYDSREHFRLDGPSRDIGGFNQAFPIMDFRGTGKSIDELAEFELRTAKELGIDGFQFFYPMDPTGNLKFYNQNIKAFFRAIERIGLDFKLTVCFCTPGSLLTENEKINLWGDSLKELLQEKAWDDIWLKTPDGRIIIYLWNCEGLSDEVFNFETVIKNPAMVAADAAAYQRLADYCGINAAYVYHVRWWMLEHTELIDQFLNYYPAFWSFIPLNSLFGKQWDAFAEKCRLRQRAYTETICPDFYTSKLFRKNGVKKYDRVFDLNDALNLGVDGMWRWVFISHLSGELRDSAERAIRTDTPVLNIVTWNDYPEGHQICPDVNKNFAFSSLLKYYSNIWKGRPELNHKDAGWVFYKKYPSSVRPLLADFEVRSECNIPPDVEDFIEAVVTLQSSAEIFLNGQNLGAAPAGLSVHRIPVETGPVRLKAVRDGAILFEFTAPEWITNEPYRTDRSTVGFSSEYSNLWTTVFGDKVPVSACEYAENAEGIPNWKNNIFLTDEILLKEIK